jgi:hypothetical protein
MSLSQASMAQLPLPFANQRCRRTMHVAQPRWSPASIPRRGENSEGIDSSTDFSLSRVQTRLLSTGFDEIVRPLVYLRFFFLFLSVCSVRCALCRSCVQPPFRGQNADMFSATRISVGSMEALEALTTFVDFREEGVGWW